MYLQYRKINDNYKLMAQNKNIFFVKLEFIFSSIVQRNTQFKAYLIRYIFNRHKNSDFFQYVQFRNVHMQDLLEYDLKLHIKIGFDYFQGE